MREITLRVILYLERYTALSSFIFYVKLERGKALWRLNVIPSNAGASDNAEPKELMMRPRALRREVARWLLSSSICGVGGGFHPS